MNRTKIEYADFTWNPVTGCLGPGGTPEEPRRCSYCYAHGLARGRLKERYLENANGCLRPARGEIDLLLYKRFWDPFWPRLWEERLAEPERRRKPAKIFVVSMGDLFHPYVPDDWIEQVIVLAETAYWHTYMFLTKNPFLYRRFEPWPENCWLGTTVTSQVEFQMRWPLLRGTDARVRFLSVEPFLRPVRWAWDTEIPDWVIMGAQTGKGAQQPRTKWVRDLTAQCEKAGVPVFHKGNLELPDGIERRREWPRKTLS